MPEEKKEKSDAGKFDGVGWRMEGRCRWDALCGVPLRQRRDVSRL